IVVLWLLQRGARGHVFVPSGGQSDTEACEREAGLDRQAEVPLAQICKRKYEGAGCIVWRCARTSGQRVRWSVGNDCGASAAASANGVQGIRNELDRRLQPKNDPRCGTGWRQRGETARHLPEAVRRVKAV